MRKSSKHPGFKGAQKSIAKREGIPMKNAGAVLASATRKASPAAKKANPRLNKVKGKSHKKMSHGQKAKKLALRIGNMPV